MKASTEKTATSTSTTATQTPQEPFFGKKGGDGFFESAPQGNSPFIQAKLTVNQPGDIYEQEADRVAEQVVQRLAMSSPEPASPLLSTAGKSPAPIQTKCADCEQEEQVQRKEEEGPEEHEEIMRKVDSTSPAQPLADIQMKCADCEQEEQIQRKEEGPEEQEEIMRQTESASPSSPGDEAGSDFSTRLQSSKGGGSPLPENTRADMESALGTDLSGVRIHTGSEAAGMSKDINAQAFTHGSDVYFNDGKFDAGSSDGKRLLAHELVHVGQQGGSGGQNIHRKLNQEVDDPSKNKSFIKISPTTIGETRTSNAVLKEKPEKEFKDSDIYLNPGEHITLLYESIEWYYIGIKNANATLNGYIEKIYVNNFITLADVAIRPPIYYEQVNQMVANNDNAFLNGLFYDFENTKTINRMRVFDSNEQRLTLENPILLDRLRSLLSKEDFEYATATWPALNLKGDISKSIKKPSKENSTRTVEKPFSFDKEWPSLSASDADRLKKLGTFTSAYHAKETNNKDTFLTEIEKLGFKGKDSQNEYQLELESLTKTLYEYTEICAVVMARKSIDASEKILTSGMGEYNDQSNAQNLINELAKTKDDYLAIQEIKKIPNTDALMHYTRDLQFNSAIHSWRAKLAPQFPIMLDENIDIEEMYEDYVEGNKDASLLKIFLLETIDDRYLNIRETKENLKENPSIVWKLDDLMTRTIEQAHLNGWIYKTLIDKKIKDENSPVADIVLGVISFGLSVLAFFSGPFAPLLFGASALIGSYITNKMYSDYDLKHNAHNIAHDQALALTSDDPSFAWIVVGMLGIGMDIGGVTAALGLFRPVIVNIKYYSQIKKIMKEAEEIADILEAEGKMLVGREVFLKGIRQIAREHYFKIELLVDEIKSMTPGERIMDRFFSEYSDLFEVTGGKMNPKVQEIFDTIQMLESQRVANPDKVASQIPLLTEKLEGMKISAEIRGLSKSIPIDRIGADRNVAFADHFITVLSQDSKPLGQINGRTIGISTKSTAYDEVDKFDKFAGFIKFAPIPENRVFINMIPGAEFDSEVKILEKFVKQISELMAKPIKLGDEFKNVTGDVLLFSEKQPCPSCQPIIKSFQKMFPNVRVKVVWAYEKTIR